MSVEYGSICQLDPREFGEYMEDGSIDWLCFVGELHAGDAPRQARHFKWGLKKWVWTGSDHEVYCRNGIMTARVRGIPTRPALWVIQTRVFNQGLASGSASQSRIVPNSEEKQNMPTDFARLPPTTGRVYATTRDQAAKTSVKLVSDMKARTLISHGCQGFLAFVMDTSLESPNIENLSVVREFADVFPNELLGLPPAREIEFDIELISRCLWWHLYGSIKGEAIEHKWPRPFYGDGGGGEECFEEIKTEIGVAPILTLPSGSGGFKIYSDASQERFGVFVFDATWEGDATASKRADSIMKVNYQPIDLELAAVVFAIEDLADTICMILHDLERLDVELCVRGSGGYWASMRIESNLMLQIKEAQRDDAVGDSYVDNGLDFIGISLLFCPTTQKRHDCDLGVVVDRLIKYAHFLPIRKNYEIRSLRLVFGMGYRKLGDSSSFQYNIYPQTDGQSDEDHSDFEDMLRACCFRQWTGSWFEYLCFGGVGLILFGMLASRQTFRAFVYGRKCQAPICWDEVGERLIEGPELIEITNEKVARIVKRFGIKGKLSPRFIGPFEILERIGEVSYRLALPPQLSHVHDVFHVSLLRGYHYHPLHVASYPFDQIQPDMSLSEEPESILDRQERVMRNKVIPFVKILWKNHPEREATWETEESMRASYPHFFV
ncbi:putative nucleotidyltransferase, ribonuclease H [Tanacetum coccineum]